LPTSTALVEHVHERLQSLYPLARVTIILSHDRTDDRVSVVAPDPEAQVARVREILAQARDLLVCDT
jgi:hypothetical protein